MKWGGEGRHQMKWGGEGRHQMKWARASRGPLAKDDSYFTAPS
jgi:hypothetical protein